MHEVGWTIVPLTPFARGSANVWRVGATVDPNDWFMYVGNDRLTIHHEKSTKVQSNKPNDSFPDCCLGTRVSNQRTRHLKRNASDTAEQSRGKKLANERVDGSVKEEMT